MENNQIMEQPLETVPEVKVSEPIAEQKEDYKQESVSNSSTYGKFKDATSLLEAYENLEKEFTRKSQKLAELLKSQESQVDGKNNQPSDVKDYENHTSTTKSEESYLKPNWQTTVAQFFEEVPEAKQYSSEIAKLIMSDKELAKNKNCLKYAYASVLANNQKHVNPADLINDPEYFNSIVENKRVKENIINNYLLSIQANKRNLHFISGEPNSISPTPSPDKPKNLKEASTILKRLLES